MTNCSHGGQGGCEDTHALHERYWKSGDPTRISAGSPPGSAER